MAELAPKSVIWMGDSLDVLREFPAPVQDAPRLSEEVDERHCDAARELDLVKARLKLAEDLHRTLEKQ